MTSASTLSFARSMRKKPAFHEARQWKLQRDRRLGRLKFRRQVLLVAYIADFVCFEHRLIVEADGPLHEPEADAARDHWLTAAGFRVLRFANARILAEPGAVLTDILAAVALGGGMSLDGVRVSPG